MNTVLDPFPSRLRLILGQLEKWLFTFWPARYGTRRYLGRDRLRKDYKLLANSLGKHLEFESVFDVGCANGFLLEEFNRQEKQVAGIELSPAAREVLPRGLHESVQIGDFSGAHGQWDLVCCVEVAEHIPSRRSQELVAKLASLAQRWIYFAAAPPGQLGFGHVNCRPHAEWLDWFADRGWTPSSKHSAALRADLAAAEQAHWLKRNSFVLHRKPERAFADDGQFSHCLRHETR